MKSALTSYDDAMVSSSNDKIRLLNDRFMSTFNHDLFMIQSAGSLSARSIHYLDGMFDIEFNRQSTFDWWKHDSCIGLIYWLDTDIMILQRQYDHLNLLQCDRLSVSVDDLLQIDRYPYAFDHTMTNGKLPYKSIDSQCWCWFCHTTLFHMCPIIMSMMHNDE
jgi:hypothetical protein